MDLRSCPCSGINLPRYLAPAILAALTGGPLHGYALLKHLQQSEFFRNQPPDQTGVYRLLKNMQQEGLLSSTFEQGERMQKRLYSLTERGIHCLAQWEYSLLEHRAYLGRFTGHLRDQLAKTRPAAPPCPCGTSATTSRIALSLEPQGQSHGQS